MNFIKKLLGLIENPFDKVIVHVFINEKFRQVQLFSYDKKGLERCVEMYKMPGFVFERKLSFFSHRHLKKTVSELRFNESGDVITSSV